MVQKVELVKGDTIELLYVRIQKEMSKYAHTGFELTNISHNVGEIEGKEMASAILVFTNRSKLA